MSSHQLRFVPTTPGFAPTAQAAAGAVALLRQLCPGGHVESRVTQEVEFVDPGQNFDGSHCSACGADTEDWWADAVDTAAATRFQNLQAVAGCCGALVDLNDLRYRSPVAFGRYVLACDYINGEPLGDADLEKLGTLLGCPVRQVEAHH